MSDSSATYELVGVRYYRFQWLRRLLGLPDRYVAVVLARGSDPDDLTASGFERRWYDLDYVDVWEVPDRD